MWYIIYSLLIQCLSFSLINKTKLHTASLLIKFKLNSSQLNFCDDFKLCKAAIDPLVTQITKFQILLSIKVSYSELLTYLLLRTVLTGWKFPHKTENDLLHVQPVHRPSWKLANSIHGHNDQICLYWIRRLFWLWNLIQRAEEFVSAKSSCSFEFFEVRHGIVTLTVAW